MSFGQITRRGDTPIRPVHGKPMVSASPSLIGNSWASAERSPPLLEVLRPHHKEGRYSDSPCPWEANEKRFAITHWQFMGTRRGDTPIRPVHGKPMERASPSLIGNSWASAERSPPLLDVLRPDHKEGRYSDSPRPWEANEKRFAFTHWHLMDIGGSECRASDSEPAQIAKRTPHGRRQSAAPCCFHTREPPWQGARVSGFALGGF
jgi:hypothetical protein